MALFGSHLRPRRAPFLGFRVYGVYKGLGFRVYGGLGFRVYGVYKGLGFRVLWYAAVQIARIFGYLQTFFKTFRVAEDFKGPDVLS